MAAWSLDEKRFREEVFRALDNRWDPQSNCSAAFSSRSTCADPAVIAAAFKAVRAFVNRNLKTGTNAGPAKVLDKRAPRRRDDAHRPDPPSNTAHRVQGSIDRAELAACTAGEARRDAPRSRPRAVQALAEARQRFFTREEVVDALRGDRAARPRAGRRCRRTDQAAREWKSVQHEVTFLGALDCARLPAEALRGRHAVTTQQLLDRQPSCRARPAATC